MPSVSFYQLSTTNLEEALPKLLEKVLETDNKALILCDTQEKVSALDGVLWSVGGTRFIPHATANDNDIEHNPVFITTEKENVIDANFLVSLNFSDDDYYKSFQRTLFIFNGASEKEVTFARSFWKKLKTDSANELKYFQQDPKGRWEEKKD